MDLSMFNLIRVAANSSSETTAIDFQNYTAAFQAHSQSDDYSTVLAFSTLQLPFKTPQVECVREVN